MQFRGLFVFCRHNLIQVIDIQVISAVARKKAVTRFFAVFYFLVSLESSSKDASDEVCHVFVNKFKIEI